MNWLNTKYIIRTGVLTTLLLFPGLISATCKTDTIINNYKPDSLRLVIKADSIIAFHEGERFCGESFSQIDAPRHIVLFQRHGHFGLFGRILRDESEQ